MMFGSWGNPDHAECIRIIHRALDAGINFIDTPLEGGWLTGKYRRGADNPLDSARSKTWVGDLGNPKFQRRLDVVEQLIPLAEAKGIPLARFANAWALRHPAVTSVIIGPRTLEQLEDSLGVPDVQITAEEAAAIDRLVPPGTSVL
jgi:aryl-alcohol dehydrogenase-like predicted oxidoreductase